MNLIVGLGNYPPKYHKTRHNFGFLALDVFAQKHHFSPWKDDKRFFGQIATGEIAGIKTLLLKPQTYMNLSGKSVQTVLHFYKIPPQNLFVFSDDLDLEFGQTRYREKGSAGGQKGLKSIIQCIGSDQFGRLKFGITNYKKSCMPTANFVVSQFSAEELQQLPDICKSGFTKFLPFLSHAH